MDSSSRNAPVAVRVIRPYSSEDELLAAEASAFTRAGVALIGAPSRPSGVVIRFEICLGDGTAVVRGEGRVVGHRPPTAGDPGALSVRFTRLDVQSKALLDRAVAFVAERRFAATSMPPARGEPTASQERAPSSAPQTRPEPLAVSPPPALPSIELPSVELDADEFEASGPPTVERDAEEMDVDDVDLASADESDLTVQQPPVALAPRDAHEKMPVPSPSPAGVPAPHPTAPKTPAPQRHAPERAPVPDGHPPDHAPAPTPSPEPKRRAAELARDVSERPSRSEFRPSLEPAQRESALQRLRSRPKNDPA